MSLRPFGSWLTIFAIKGRKARNRDDDGFAVRDLEADFQIQTAAAAVAA
jgi:hypothetical protein